MNLEVPYDNEAVREARARLKMWRKAYWESVFAMADARHAAQLNKKPTAHTQTEKKK